MRRRVNNSIQNKSKNRNRNRNNSYITSISMPSTSTSTTTSSSSTTSPSKVEKTMTPLHTASPSIHQSLGITQRRTSNAPILSTAPSSQNLTSASPSSSSSRPQSPQSTFIPPISDFMMLDDEYGMGAKKKFSTSSNTYHSQYAYNIQCAKFCTYFSFIAILFLVMVGILIEVQPLYIKGVSPNRVPLSFRQMRESGKVQNEHQLLSYVHYSGRLRMLQSYYLRQNQRSSKSTSSLIDTSSSILNQKLGTYDDDPTTNYIKYNDYLRNLSDEQKEYIVYEMKAEAKTSFKAAALYFLVMVFCIIYTNNLERVHLILGVGFNMYVRKMKHFVLNGGWKRCFVILLNRYRRRNYRDIPEQKSSLGKNSASGFGGGVVGIGSDCRSIGVDNVKVGDPSPNLRHNLSCDESIGGFSLRERDPNIVGGVHFEQQDQLRVVKTSKSDSFDDLEDKPKRK